MFTVNYSFFKFWWPCMNIKSDPAIHWSILLYTG